jgi:hypothetical protein
MDRKQSSARRRYKLIEAFTRGKKSCLEEPIAPDQCRLAPQTGSDHESSQRCCVAPAPAILRALEFHAPDHVLRITPGVLGEAVRFDGEDHRTGIQANKLLGISSQRAVDLFDGAVNIPSLCTQPPGHSTGPS